MFVAMRFRGTSAHRERILMEDALKHLLDREQSGGASSVDGVAGALGCRRGRAAHVLGLLRSRGLANPEGEGWRLNEEGRLYALQILRTHRLYETYLARETGVPARDWHRQADSAEHRLDAEAAEALANRLNDPRFDPHGDPIPTREGELPGGKRVCLAEWPAGMDAVIEHVEDEPEEVFQRILKQGLYPGVVLERPEPEANGGVGVWTEGRALVIPGEWLGMIHVGRLQEDSESGRGLSRLSDLALGEEATVQSLSQRCVGPERSRLLDLGLVPGTRVRAEFESPFRSPRSYLIRGTMIALRREQAEKVLILSEPGTGK